MDLLETLTPIRKDWTGWHSQTEIMEHTGWTDTTFRRRAAEKIASGEWETEKGIVNGKLRNMFRLKPAIDI